LSFEEEDVGLGGEGDKAIEAGVLGLPTSRDEEWLGLPSSDEESGSIGSTRVGVE